ncbi:MAG TPA: hypothetical protein VFT22_07830 [Kofleriaceae bacterium]|nr:hypothetical protein [Kofleriaceae bacterium]
MRSIHLGWMAFIVACAGPAPSDNEPVATSESALSTTYNNISYHGGPVLSDPTVYVIWYGTWNRPTVMSTIYDFIGHVGGTPYWAIHSTYSGASGASVSAGIALASQSMRDPYSLGHTLHDADLAAIVNHAITSGGLPCDPNGIYLVLGDMDTTLETNGYINGAFHSYTSPIPGAPPVAAAWVWYGPGATWPGPNGDMGLDAVVAEISHELSEATLSPFGSAWWDDRIAPPENEGADKCAWGTGPDVWSSGSGQANVHVGSHDFLVQTQWVNEHGGYCGIAVEPDRAALTVAFMGSSSNSVATSDGASCDASSSFCTYSYRSGTQVTLTASATGTTWTGCDSASGSTCTVSVGADRTVTVGSQCTLDRTCQNECLIDCANDGNTKARCTAVCRAMCCQ